MLKMCKKNSFLIPQKQCVNHKYLRSIFNLQFAFKKKFFKILNGNDNNHSYVKPIIKFYTFNRFRFLIVVYV